MSDTLTEAATAKSLKDKLEHLATCLEVADRLGLYAGNFYGLEDDPPMLGLSYESAKGKPGWPEEKELKGKKEYVMVGSGLQNVEVQHE